DKTGLTSGLTEKVSMSDELTTFHKKQDAAAAERLQQKIGIYQTALSKHKNAKYYSKLLKLVGSQQDAVQTGLTIQADVVRIEKVTPQLTELTTRTAPACADRIKKTPMTRANEEQFTERCQALAERGRQFNAEVGEARQKEVAEGAGGLLASDME